MKNQIITYFKNEKKYTSFKQIQYTSVKYFLKVFPEIEQYIKIQLDSSSSEIDYIKLLFKTGKIKVSKCVICR